jgi:hypothetical protein
LLSSFQGLSLNPSKSSSKCFDFPPLCSTKEDISKFVDKCLPIFYPNSIIYLVEMLFI